MMSKSLFLLLLIMTKINLILSSISLLNEESPTCVAVINSGGSKVAKLASINSDEKHSAKLISGTKSCDEEEEEEGEGEEITVIVEEKEKAVVEERVEEVEEVEERAEGVGEVGAGSSKKTDENGLTKEERKRLKKWMKINDPDVYYTLPFGPGDYLPAYKAALKSNIKKLELLADRAITFEKYDAKTGETPLHAACRRGNVEVFKFICSKIRDVNSYSALNRAGRSPFSIAVSSGNDELVLMMSRHCQVFKCDLPDYEGKTPLMYAGLQQNTRLFKFLKNLGQNHLHRDKSGQTLLSLILPSNRRISKILIRLIAEDMRTDKEGTIRTIAKDLFVIYENETLGGEVRVKEILAKLGTNLDEVILVPQVHRYNIINVILRNKDYDHYQRLRNLPGTSFDINSSNLCNRYSFFETCLQNGSLDMIDYLLKNDDCKFYESSLEAIFLVDRVEVLEFLFENYPNLITMEDPFDVIVESGIRKANKCFKFLLKKYWKDGGGIELFCSAAVHICCSYEVEPILNLFNNFAKGLANCPVRDLEMILSDLMADSMFDEDTRRLKRAVNYIKHLLREKRKN